MAQEPSDFPAHVTVRLIGGPFGGQLVTVPEGTQVWEITEAPMETRRPYEAERSSPGGRHVYRLQSRWRPKSGTPVPFVYAGVVGGDEGA